MDDEPTGKIRCYHWTVHSYYLFSPKNIQRIVCVYNNVKFADDNLMLKYWWEWPW